MNNASKPIKVSVVRIEEIFENENPYSTKNTQSVIKDYIYCPEKKVIA